MARETPCSGLESKGRKVSLSLKTLSLKHGGFDATPDQMGWVSEKVHLTPDVLHSN